MTEKIIREKLPSPGDTPPACGDGPVFPDAVEKELFTSILSRRPEDRLDEKEEPEFFGDLNLDQIVENVTAQWKDSDLVPFFRTPLRDPDAVLYRQEIMMDLEKDDVMQCVLEFLNTMAAMRRKLTLSKKSRYRYEKERWFLAAAETYCSGVETFRLRLGGAELRSGGMRKWRGYLEGYAASRAFRCLAEETAELTAALSAIRYCLLIRGNRITVRPYEGEEDFVSVIEGVFEKFRVGETESYLVKFSDQVTLNHVEARILERVALLNPETFTSLVEFFGKHAAFADRTIVRFDQEIRFYTAFLLYIGKFRSAGLDFCYPRISRTSKEISARDTFDLALAEKLLAAKMPVVRNDFFLGGRERIFVVSGPNQGGKTTFARMFGQLHYLAALGCPVPGTDGALFLPDRIFTHFEKMEDIGNLRGKLQDDLVRIHRILEEASPDSVVIMNEIFSSTTLKDADYLSRKILGVLCGRDLLGVFVSFLTELASFSEKTVSLVGAVDQADVTVRTFRMERRPPDGLAYALAVAEKHKVTYRWLKERIRT